MPNTEFENEPSNLDELTHLELHTMHTSASSAILFAKLIQWLSVAFALILLCAAVFLVKLTPYDKSLTNLLTMGCILLTCGTVFFLFLYQMWQFNEIKRIRQIEKHFSSLSRHVNNLESRGERNVERYTVLTFMALVLIVGAVIAVMAIR